MYVTNIIKAKNISCFLTYHFLDDSKHKFSKHKHISSSINSLREAVQRIPKPHISTSRTSVNSEQKPPSEVSDTTSLQIPYNQQKSSMYPTWSSG